MTPGKPIDRSRDYSAILYCAAGDSWLPEAHSQIASWLREKGFDVSLDESSDNQHETASLAVRSMQDGSVGDLKVVLSEDTPLGVWTTEILAHDEPGERDWITIRVANSEGRLVKVPRVARYLMQVLPLRDGLLELEDSYRLVGEGQLDDLIAVLVDEQRHGLAFVAGSSADSGIPVDAWARQVGDWSREVHGLGKVFVLDPAATQAFASRMGADLAATPWSIRTYLPAVRPGERHEALRHRFLSTRRLADEKDSVIRRLLGDIARQHAVTRAPDPAVQRVQRRFDRLENRRLVDHLAADTAPDTTVLLTPGSESEGADLGGATVAEPHAEEVIEDQRIHLVKRVLGVSQITEQSLSEFVARLRGRDEGTARDALTERVNQLQENVEQLQDQNQILTEALQDAQLETEIAHIDLDDRSSEIRWLRARLHERNDYEADYLAVPPEFMETRPATFDDLLDRLEQIDGVSFSGDVKEVLALNQKDTNCAALRVAWDATLVLCDYVRARASGDWGAGLDQYIEHTPKGYRSISAGKFAESETGVTMRSFGEERIFPVPTRVHHSGFVAMKAHFKLARIGMVSPRMHVYDAHPDLPEVFIGYIGAHLTNTQS